MTEMLEVIAAPKYEKKQKRDNYCKPASPARVGRRDAIQIVKAKLFSERHFRRKRSG